MQGHSWRTEPMRMDHSQSQGLTILELVVASGISLLLVLGVSVLFLSQARAYHDVKIQHELQQDLRVCVDAIGRDLRHAGYGLPANRTWADDWVTWASNLTNGVSFEPATGTLARTVHIVGGFDTQVSTLALSATNGATVIRVASGTGPAFDRPENRVLFLGHSETVRVISRSGDLLRISAHPVQSAAGLVYDHPVGTIVEAVSGVAYRRQPLTGRFPNSMALLREPRGAGAGTAWVFMVAGDIEELQITHTSHCFDVVIRGRSAAELFHPPPGSTDTFARLAVSTRVLPRNTPPLRMVQR